MINYQDVHKIIPILKSYIFNSQNNFLIKMNLLNNVLIVIKNHLSYQFKILTYISGLDYPENYHRFSVVYELLSVKCNSRVRVKTLVDEVTPLNSIENVYLGAGWWEDEVWDMFGIYFLKKTNITRLLTDYGFQGYPLRKDFPLTGFVESRYSLTKNRVVYEHVELAQEYRTFNYLSPWEELYKK